MKLALKLYDEYFIIVNHHFMSYSDKISKIFEGSIFIGYSQYITTCPNLQLWLTNSHWFVYKCIIISDFLFHLTWSGFPSIESKSIFHLIFRSFEYSTYWVPLFKTLTKGGCLMAQEGFKRKLLAILSVINDKISCILVNR